MKMIWPGRALGVAFWFRRSCSLALFMSEDLSGRSCW